MDISAQLKKSLIARIKDSKDINFLKALQTIFDATEQQLYDLSHEQQAAIDTGRNEIAAGDSISNEEVIVEMKEWLAKK